jgi:hypothetical protein
MRSCKNVVFHGCKKPQTVRLGPNIKRVKQLKIDGFCPIFDRFCPLCAPILGPSIHISRTDCRSVQGSGFRVGDAPEHHGVGQWKGVCRE